MGHMHCHHWYARSSAASVLRVRSAYSDMDALYVSEKSTSSRSLPPGPKESSASRFLIQLA
jgi:hypothetical protein